jgi:hypothetical protein
MAFGSDENRIAGPHEVFSVNGTELATMAMLR